MLKARNSNSLHSNQGIMNNIYKYASTKVNSPYMRKYFPLNCAALFI